MEMRGDKSLITSRSNRLIKQVQALRHRKARAETGLFLVEGIHPVGEAVEAGWEIEFILYAPDVLISHFARDLLSRLSSKIQPISAKLMDSLSDKDNPQGILAVVHQQKSRLVDLQSASCGAAIVSPQDPGNVGTILRTLDAVKADALFLLDGGVDPYHPTSVRASMGTIFWTPIIRASFDEFVGWSKRNAIQLIGTSAHAETDYLGIRPDRPWILLLGSEQKGLSPEHLEICSSVISLPMRGRASSLNLSVAAGILLYRFTEAA
jgi:RNA methyltransferase, TrmH family